MIKEVEILNTVKISSHGGSRKNSGRKPKLQYEARELFNLEVDKRWPKILEKIDELIQKGDKDVLKMLIDQRIGKPTSTVNMPKIENTQNNIFLRPEIMRATKQFDEVMKSLIYAERVVSN